MSFSMTSAHTVYCSDSCGTNTLPKLTASLEFDTIGQSSSSVLDLPDFLLRLPSCDPTAELSTR